MNPGYKPGERFGASFETDERTRSHRPDLDDASARSDLIWAPQPVNIDQTKAVQIGGYLRIAADQRWLLAVIRFRGPAPRETPIRSPVTAGGVPGLAGGFRQTSARHAQS